jgi:hypothetical protein
LHVLGAEAFYDEYIEEALITFVSCRFEKVCRDYFSLQAQAGKLKGVSNIGSYYYDDSVPKRMESLMLHYNVRLSTIFTR